MIEHVRATVNQVDQSSQQQALLNHAADATESMRQQAQALIAAVPRITTEKQGAVVKVAAGDIPSVAKPPSGCHFHTRCPQAMEVCRTTYPSHATLSATRVVHCHLYGKN